MENLINEKIAQAHQDILVLKRMNSKLEELYRQMYEANNRCLEAKEVLDKEDMEVEKLEEKSILHLFHSILGNYEEKISKEKQEAMAARLKYDQASIDKERIDKDILALEDEKAKYRGSNERYQQLMKKKKEYILAENSERSESIFERTIRIDKINNQIREIEEAIRAGRNALNHLELASGSLESAEGWGTWDLIGGGLLTDMMKHSHIDDAKAEVEETHAALMDFRTELADIKMSCDITFNTDGFGKFADFYFDGLIADWCMQSRIEESHESVSTAIRQIENVLSKLEDMKSENNAQLASLNKEIADIVEKA